MFINSVYVENFRPYKDRVVYEFTEGINLIVGKNGHGKSTIIHAVRLLLLDLKEKQLNLEGYINFDNPTYFDIGMEFEHEGHHYSISFCYTKKGKSFESQRVLKVDGVHHSENSEAVTYLSHLFDPNLIRYALFSMQRQAEIVEVSDAERQALLKKIEDLNFQEEVKKIEAEIARLTANRESIEKDIYRLETKPYDLVDVPTLPMTEVEYTEATNRKNSVQAQVDSLKAEIAVLDKQLLEKGELDREMLTLTADITQLNKGIAEVTSAIENLAVEKEQKRNTLSTSIETTKATITAKGSETFSDEQWSTQIPFKEQKIVEIEKQIGELKIGRMVAFDISQAATLTEQKIVLQTKLNSLTEQYDLAKQGECPVCGSALEHMPDTEVLEAEILEVKKSLDVINAAITEYNTSKDEYDRRKEKVAEDKLTKQKYEAEILTLTTGIKTLKETIESQRNSFENVHALELQGLQSTLSALEEEYKNLDAVFSERAQARTELLAAHNSALSSKSAQTSSIEGRQAILAGTSDAKIRADEQLRVTAENLSNIDSSLTHYSVVLGQREQAEKQNIELEVLKTKETQELATFRTNLDTLRETILANETAKVVLLKDLPNFILNKKLGVINTSMNDFVEEVYNKPLNLRLKQSKSSMKLLYGGEKGISAQASSGAEKTLIQTSFINVYNQAMHLGCLFLDEPDASADDDNSRKLFEMVGSMSEVYKQLFIITHNKDMREYLNNHYSANVINV